MRVAPARPASTCTMALSGRLSREREGNREAKAIKNKEENEAASRGMMMFLGCGKRVKDSLTENVKAKTLRLLESDNRTNGRTLERGCVVLNLIKNLTELGLTKEGMMKSAINTPYD
jgi:hypothetical protein